MCFGQTEKEAVEPWNRTEGIDEVTIQEDGQLKVVVEHDGLHAARPAQPRCDFTQEVGVENEEEGT